MPSPETEAAELPKAFEIDKKTLGLAKKVGVDLQPVVDWANKVELELYELKKTLPAEIQKSMENAIEAQRQKQLDMYKRNIEAARTGAPTPENMGLGQLLPILQMVAGGGQDDEMTQLSKDMMRMNILRMKKDLDFTDAIKNAVVTKIAGKAAAGIV